MRREADRLPGSEAKHILIIEDNEDGRESLCLLLRTLGHEVETAPDGQAGVGAALQLRPDVVLIDIGLPVLDGYEVGRRLRAALGASTALVACTAYDDPAACRRVDEAGFDGHAVKPISVAELAPWLGTDPSANGLGRWDVPGTRARRCPGRITPCPNRLPPGSAPAPPGPQV